MLKRNERGKLTLNTLDMQIMFGDLFEHCNTRKEAEWLYDNLQSSLEIASEEKAEQLLEEEDET